ncbi:MAG: hypothetical protein U0136_06235 [Bdellovibrionota bacterium]
MLAFRKKSTALACAALSIVLAMGIPTLSLYLRSQTKSAQDASPLEQPDLPEVSTEPLHRFPSAYLSMSAK